MPLLVLRRDLCAAPTLRLLPSNFIHTEVRLVMLCCVPWRNTNSAQTYLRKGLEDLKDYPGSRAELVLRDLRRLRAAQIVAFQFHLLPRIVVGED